MGKTLKLHGNELPEIAEKILRGMKDYAELVADVADAVELEMLPRGRIRIFEHFRIEGWSEDESNQLSDLVRRELSNRAIERARGER